jgi:hypothetical protein
VWRIAEILRYGGSKGGHAGLPSPELLSIAVAPLWRGRQCAEGLYRCLTDHFGVQGIPAFKFTVGAGLGPAHRFDQRMGAVPVVPTEVHRGAPSTVYVHHIAQD